MPYEVFTESGFFDCAPSLNAARKVAERALRKGACYAHIVRANALDDILETMHASPRYQV